MQSSHWRAHYFHDERTVYLSGNAENNFFSRDRNDEGVVTHSTGMFKQIEDSDNNSSLRNYEDMDTIKHRNVFKNLNEIADPNKSQRKIFSDEKSNVQDQKLYFIDFPRIALITSIVFNVLYFG